MHAARLSRGAFRLFVLVVVSVVGLAVATMAQAHASVPVPNPDFRATCGANVVLVLDESSSIGQFPERTAQVRAAANAFAEGLKDTSSKLAVVEFASEAAAAIPFREVTSANIGQFTNYFNGGPGAPSGGYNPWTSSNAGYTNWQDAFRKVGALDPGPGEPAPVIVFVTDGDPTAYFRPDGTFVLNDGGAGLPQAVVAANDVKKQGRHIFAVAVGNALSNSASLDRLRSITDSDASVVVTAENVANLNLATDDILRVTEFDTLPHALMNIARDLCRSEVNITKLVDRADGTAPVPAEGWEFTGTVAIAPDMWVLPADARGTTATVATGADGTTTFKWRSTNPAPTDLVVTETPEPGHTLASVVCRKNDGAPVSIAVQGTRFTVPGIGDTDRVDCTVTNVFAADPAIAIEKSTVTPVIPVGGTVIWTLAVTNTGNVPLTDVAVSDPLAPGCGALIGELAVGRRREITCTSANVAEGFTNVATVVGAYGQRTVTARAEAPVQVSAAPVPEPGAVTLVPTRLAITKVGPTTARSGSLVTYTVAVRNTGDAEAQNVVLVDRIPPGMSFSRASIRPRIVRGQVHVRIGNLAPGRTRVVKFTFRIDTRAKGTRTNVATAKADNARTVRAKARTRIVRVAGVVRSARVVG